MAVCHFFFYVLATPRWLRFTSSRYLNLWTQLCCALAALDWDLRPGEVGTPNKTTGSSNVTAWKRQNKRKWWHFFRFPDFGQVFFYSICVVGFDAQRFFFLGGGLPLRSNEWGLSNQKFFLVFLGQKTFLGGVVLGQKSLQASFTRALRPSPHKQKDSPIEQVGLLSSWSSFIWAKFKMNPPYPHPHPHPHPVGFYILRPT